MQVHTLAICRQLWRRRRGRRGLQAMRRRPGTAQARLMGPGAGWSRLKRSVDVVGGNQSTELVVLTVVTEVPRAHNDRINKATNRPRRPTILPAGRPPALLTIFLRTRLPGGQWDRPTTSGGCFGCDISRSTNSLDSAAITHVHS